MLSFGVDFGGGPYEAPDEQRWDSEEDGCPRCHGDLQYADGRLWCDSCERWFWEDGEEVAEE